VCVANCGLCRLRYGLDRFPSPLRGGARGGVRLLELKIVGSNPWVSTPVDAYGLPHPALHIGEAARHDPAMRKVELEELLALGAKGLVRPMVSERVPLERFADAMRMLAERRAIGRVALVIEAASSVPGERE
jgi:hypothetical protein